MKVEVVQRHRSRRLDAGRLRRVVKRCAKLLPSGSMVGVAFLSDREMTGINEKYTGRRGTTDVLSFPLGRDLRGGIWSGEILISLDRAARQAKEKGVTLTNEVIRLLVHAMVHLGGHDHYDPDGFLGMRRLEFELLLRCLK